MFLKVILTTPLTRALETATAVATAGTPIEVRSRQPLLAFCQSDLELMPQVTALHTEHDHGAAPCDTGRPASQLRKLFPLFDFGGLKEDWWPIHETPQDLAERVERFYDSLKSRKETIIGVIGHAKFIQMLLYHHCSSIICTDSQKPRIINNGEILRIKL